MKNLFDFKTNVKKRVIVKDRATDEQTECNTVAEVKDFIANRDIKKIVIESNLTWNTIDGSRFLAAGSSAFRVYGL